MTTSTDSTRAGRWRLAGRVVWLLFAIASFGVFFISLPQFTGQTDFPDCPTPESVCQPNSITNSDLQVAAAAGVPRGVMVGFYVAVSLSARLSLALVGVAIFLLRPNDRLACIMSLVLLTGLMEGVANLGPLQSVVNAIFFIGTMLWLPIPYIFPNGRFEPAWTKWPVIVLTVVLGPFWQPSLGPILPPLALVAVNLLSVIWTVGGLYSLIYRYRRVATPVERQQTKWVVVGFLAVFVVGLIYTYLQVIFPPWRPSNARLLALFVNGCTYMLGYGLLAASLMFAILRYRLWDIDVVIRRTLLYSLLTLTLALIYFGAVVVLQPIFSGLTGQNSLAIIGSTLLIAALFQPLRRRLQRLIDRRFYRRKYDAGQALAGFAAAARDDINLTDVTTGLLAVVDETMQPASSDVWLRPLAEAPPRAGR